MYWFLTILIIPYICLLIKIWYGLRLIVPFKPTSVSDVFVSVVVPCNNEQENLPALLNYLSDQLYPPDKFEVIIVDDNSTDNTLEIAGKGCTIKNLIIIENAGQGKKEALRTGIERSVGNLIITTDADCKPGNKWVQTIASCFSEHSPQLIICPVILSERFGFFSRAQELEFLSLQGITAGTATIGNPVMCNGANLAFTPDTYEKHKTNLHFEIESGDDMFLLISLKKSGESKIIWLESGEATITTAPSGNPASFIRQRSRWFSKWKYYDDFYLNLLSVVVFSTNLLIVCTLIAGIFQTRFLALYSILFLLKSVPDFLILANTAKRYNKVHLLKFFFPTQIIYPFYVIMVAIVHAIWNPGWKKNHSFMQLP